MLGDMLVMSVLLATFEDDWSVDANSGKDCS